VGRSGSRNFAVSQALSANQKIRVGRGAQGRFGRVFDLGEDSSGVFIVDDGETPAHVSLQCA